MSDFPKPSALAGIPTSDSEVEIPAGLFFEAGDYTPANTEKECLAETQRKVARHRSKLKATLALQLEDLVKINNGTHAADRQGNAAAHWDSAVTLVGKIQHTVAAIAKQIDNAEQRYEEACLVSAEGGAA